MCDVPIGRADRAVLVLATLEARSVEAATDLDGMVRFRVGHSRKIPARYRESWLLERTPTKHLGAQLRADRGATRKLGA